MSYEKPKEKRFTLIVTSTKLYFKEFSNRSIEFALLKSDARCFNSAEEARSTAGDLTNITGLTFELGEA